MEATTLLIERRTVGILEFCVTVCAIEHDKSSRLLSDYLLAGAFIDSNQSPMGSIDTYEVADGGALIDVRCEEVNVSNPIVTAGVETSALTVTRGQYISLHISEMSLSVSLGASPTEWSVEMLKICGSCPHFLLKTVMRKSTLRGELEHFFLYF